MQFVDLERARVATGVRLVVVGSAPSPWSEAAKGIFVVKEIDGVLVRFAPSDQAVKQWTGHHNVPVLLIGSEPPRTHWSDIIEAAERLGGHASLIPTDADARIQMFGLAHELMGDGGLVWNSRLLVIHRGLTSEGREGFPLRLASYLAPKSGYDPERAAMATARARSILERFRQIAETSRACGGQYLLGDRLSALDIYLATALAVVAPMPEDECPGVLPAVRRAFETAYPDITAAVPVALREHRDFIGHGALSRSLTG
jgi:glutathione S-transferase